MQSPWLTDERNNDHHHRGQQQVPEYGFTAAGLVFERSTSAPPPGTSLLFGSSRSSRDGTGVKVSYILNDVMQCNSMRCDVM